MIRGAYSTDTTNNGMSTGTISGIFPYICSTRKKSDGTYNGSTQTDYLGTRWGDGRMPSTAAKPSFCRQSLPSRRLGLPLRCRSFASVDARLLFKRKCVRLSKTRGDQRKSDHSRTKPDAWTAGPTAIAESGSRPAPYEEATARRRESGTNDRVRNTACKPVLREPIFPVDRFRHTRFPRQACFWH